MGVAAIDAVHRLIEIRSRRLHEQVVVVPHETVRVAHELVSNRRPLDEPEKATPVFIRQVDWSSEVSPARDVVDAVGTLDATGGTHAAEGTDASFAVGGLAAAIQ